MERLRLGYPNVFDKRLLRTGLGRYPTTMSHYPPLLSKSIYRTTLITWSLSHCNQELSGFFSKYTIKLDSFNFFFSFLKCFGIKSKYQKRPKYSACLKIRSHILILQVKMVSALINSRLFFFTFNQMREKREGRNESRTRKPVDGCKQNTRHEYNF